MLYNEPRLNKQGQPICEICGAAYDKLLQHVSLCHGISPEEYKRRFNLNPRKGVQSKKLTSAMRKRVKANYKSVVLNNLIIGGKNTRFKKGNQATDRSKVKITMEKRWNEIKKQNTKTKDEMFREMILKLS